MTDLSSIHFLRNVATIANHTAAVGLQAVGAGAFGGKLAGAGANLTQGELLSLQLQKQEELMMISMQSNLLKSDHEAQMACIRHLKP